MPRAWRITKAKYAAQAFDGEGARLYGGRWSSPGIRVVYAAESLSLAILEVLVHLQNTAPLAAYVVGTIDFPDALLETLSAGDLPANWRDYPTPPENQALGDHFVQQATGVILRVPSAITVQEHNYLINPAHADFQRCIVSEPAPPPRPASSCAC